MIPILIFGAISALVFLVIAELFGRARHIGRWWTFFLLWGGMIIPGVIAWLLSPSAKKEPFKGNKSLELIGTLLWVGGIITLAITIQFWNEIDHILINIPIQLFVVGIYLDSLGKGKIINKKPKFYNGNFTLINSDFFKRSKISSQINHTFYYIIKDGSKNGPYTYDELAKQYIFENDYVWRKGMENWIKAKDLPELSSIIVYNPPPLPTTI
jgi:hypothetical protein